MEGNFSTLSSVRLKLIELDLQWPDDLPIGHLRSWLIAQLSEFGEPLRWAVTGLIFRSNADCYPQLKVEAVIIISDFSGKESQ